MKKNLLLLAVPALLLCACSGSDTSQTDSSIPGDDSQEIIPLHIVEPTPEIIEAAEQQCRDDNSLDEGYVRAVDPTSGQTFMEYSVDCGEIN